MRYITSASRIAVGDLVRYVIDGEERQIEAGIVERDVDVVHVHGCGARVVTFPRDYAMEVERDA